MSSCGACKGCASGCGSGPPITPAPDGRPRVIWDGDCTFCRRWATRLYALTGETFAWTSLQKVEGGVTIEREHLEQAIHLQQDDGTTVRGAEAMCTILSQGGTRRWPLWLYRQVPGVAPIAERTYAWIAAHRSGADRVSRGMLGRVEIPDTWQFTRRIVLRCMGLIWLIAFLSLGQQVLGLVGSDGLRPIETLLTNLRLHAPNVGLAELPTLQWFGGDTLLQATCVIGALAGGLLMVGVLPLVSAAVCWVCYLSLVVAGGIFTGYQWDALLLEAGLLTMLWAPCTRTMRSADTRPSPLVRWLFVVLLIKLMFLSGWVKLASSDPVWANGTALDYHFWTQPLPWWPAWYAALAPDWLLHLACKCMFIIELWVPWLLLLPRVPRTIGALLIIVFQLGIAATGNYGFFNWLAIVLCLAMIDDAMLLLLWPRAVRHRFAVGMQRRGACWGRIARALCCVVVLSVSIPQLPWWRESLPSLVQRWTALWRPWHVASNYGLFATMTTTRPELVIESSPDGRTWTPFAFNDKPGPLDEAPRLSQPGMPRLDWQLWFDALAYERIHAAGLLNETTAFRRFTRRQILPDLLEHLAMGTPAVRRLLADASSSQPTTHLRWSLWRYTFTTEGEDWWSRELVFRSPALSTQPARPATTP